MKNRAEDRMKEACGLGSWLKTGAVTITSKWWKLFVHVRAHLCVRQWLLIVDHNFTTGLWGLSIITIQCSLHRLVGCTFLSASTCSKYQNWSMDISRRGRNRTEVGKKGNSVKTSLNLQLITADTPFGSRSVAQSLWDTRGWFCGQATILVFPCIPATPIDKCRYCSHETAEITATPILFPRHKMWQGVSMVLLRKRTDSFTHTQSVEQHPWGGSQALRQFGNVSVWKRKKGGRQSLTLTKCRRQTAKTSS